ncbi:HAMP domain-containing histidine kinase [Streptomyces sp. Je 1-79]|uniref:sensor histidine kinase n=1 Tax=Streptomyces sp. Je 1-79 TaxID=2943847 RepID=UPI0021A7CAAE|nr:HAMP domain-containing sensor histidine kinase [Streptomyces sp. Je 1-79]MCT4357257.1 HAMP domain-containing histidine kinase [Streptomyces sp. Je 1-79]
MLIAIVATVIGTVTTIAYRSYLYDQADGQLRNVSTRAKGPPPSARATGDPGGDPLAFVLGPGAPLGTVGAVVVGGGALGAADRSVEVDAEQDGYGPKPESSPLDEAQRAALEAAPRDEEPHTVELPGLGDYRVAYVSGGNGDILVGLPLTELQSSLSTLVLVEVSVTGAGLVAASLAGGALVGIALRPLRRVAATATQVSELPLHSGEPALHHRVPEADPRTEVGQVGAAINRMLDHVHSALHARQQSETRVRQFVADASHELRTPLASIRGYAELTRRGREECGPDTRHALGRIESEATRMTGLVEDLLLLARLDAGRPLSYESTALAPLVVDALSDARAAGPGHHWRLELAEPAVSVRADDARLHQVLVNLLANARTHTPPGTVVTARVRTEGGRALVEIEDDGPGIPPELLPVVFERFAKGDASRTRQAGGSSSGLGLAIVRAVTAAHGGEVTVRSRPGKTVFTVALPLEYGPGDGPQPGPDHDHRPGPDHDHRPDPDHDHRPDPDHDRDRDHRPGLGDHQPHPDHAHRHGPHDSQAGHRLITQP